LPTLTKPLLKMPSKTTPIPAWSAQITYNGPKDERDLLERLRQKLGARSMGQLLKQLVALGVAAKCPGSAAELREIRRRYYGSTLLLIFLGALAISWVDHDEMNRGCRRCARRPGTRFEECVTVEVEEA